MSRGSKEFLASLPGGGNMEAIRELLQQQPGNAPGGPRAGMPSVPSGLMPMVRDDGRRQALLDRAIKDPKKAFSALSKMAKNFSPEQKQQLHVNGFPMFAILCWVQEFMNIELTTFQKATL